MVSARRVVVILIVAGMVVLAGCSSGLSTDSPSPEADSPSEPAPSENETSTQSPTGSLEIHYINVGPSVSTLIVGPTGETMLVDTGHYNDDGEYVLEYLQRHDITRIDHLVTSHADADHIGGHAAIIEYYETNADGIGAVYDPGVASSTQTYAAYLDAVDRHNVTLYETREGDSLAFSGVDVAVLGPPEPYLDGEDRNENSLVVKLTYGETSVLLTGDAEADQEAYLVSTYGDQLQTTILKAGHHGSASSTSAAFLDAAQPQAVVISSAYESQYGHPAEEVISRLDDRAVPTYWTATHGDIVFTTDGENVTVATQRDATTEPTALRNGEPISVGSSEAVANRSQFTGGGTVQLDSGGTSESEDGTASTSPAAEALTLVEVNADAAGDDRENLTDEYLVIANTGDEPIELGGWRVRDEAGKVYTIPAGVVLEASDRLTLRTGSGTDTAEELYWNASAPVWNNDGDTVTVTNSTGTVVLEESYT